MFENKIVLVLGERDGVAGPASAACGKSAGGNVEYPSTECCV